MTPIAEQAGEALRADKGTVRLTLEQARAIEAMPGPASTTMQITCPVCGAWRWNHPAEKMRHAPDCWLAAAIKEAEKEIRANSVYRGEGHEPRTWILARLRRGLRARVDFVESHLTKGIAYQIRATREQQRLTERELAKRVGTSQQAISRLENPDYGKLTLRTLKQVASALDVGLIVRFVPFSEMVDWITATPRVNEGLSAHSLAVPSFEEEERTQHGQHSG